MRVILLCLSLAATASPVAAQDGALGLAAPAAVVQSGLLRHILPRFSLKTGIPVVADADGAMTLADTPPGVAVFQGGGVTYFLRISDHKRQQRFRDWLTSEIGKRTIDSFRPDGAQPFSASIAEAVAEPVPVFNGDAVRGGELSNSLCARCHVIGPQNRMKGLGSTPSFGVLRSLADWDIRFRQFYRRPPHGAFTRIDGVTAPFDPTLPPPIVPLEITLDEIESILTFVAGIEPADLGAPLQTQ